MGLFFHEMDRDFQKYGTGHWNQERSFSSACLLEGDFMEAIGSKRTKKSLRFSLTLDKIYLTIEGDLCSLDLCLTAM